MAQCRSRNHLCLMFQKCSASRLLWNHVWGNYDRKRIGSGTLKTIHRMLKRHRQQNLYQLVTRRCKWKYRDCLSRSWWFWCYQESIPTWEVYSKQMGSQVSTSSALMSSSCFLKAFLRWLIACFSLLIWFWRSILWLTSLEYLLPSTKSRFCLWRVRLELFNVWLYCIGLLPASLLLMTQVY